MVNTLREKDGLLCTRDSMTKFCYHGPEAELRETTAPSTVLRCRRPSTPICSGAIPIMETTLLSLRLRCPISGTPTWKRPNRASGLSRPATRSCSAFRWRHIRIFTGGGETADRTCRFIDETILKPAEGIPAPFIISANLRSDWSKLTGA